ncbi:MAG: hypothetical protein HWE25_00340 [Alphaproteobacteria bacterium]|nr:hypothetical protein [Alphaproteobacteria bacterium]
MSDISGPPLPKPIDPVNRTTGKTGTVSKDPQKQETQTKNERGDTSARNESAEQLKGREPAVSISASAAHLHIGEELKENVTKIDKEGRPIIVTETATFALRPDAGLKPGDDVRLEIVEAGKTLSADLLERNGRLIDPPIKLSLIVIAIHKKESPTSEEAIGTQTQSPRGYAPSVKSGIAPSGNQADLANILAATTNTTSGIKDQHRPGAQLNVYSPEGFQTKLTSNPDPISGKSNSTDLATLIAAQQQKSPNIPPPFAKPAALPEAQKQDQAHFIPQSTLTAPSSANLPSEFSANGLGPVVQAISLSGQPVSIQQLDTAVSEVSPRQVAIVNSVRSLASEEARNLPITLASLSAPDVELSVIETTKGEYILPLQAAQQLQGEYVRLDAAANRPEGTSAHITQYAAKLVTAANTEKTSISLILHGETNSSAANAKIRAVHTVRAFLTPNGPQSDLRLETTRGDVFITLPNAVRPIAGDLVEILPQNPANTKIFGGGLQASQPHAVIPPEGATALGTIGATAWPALTEASAALTQAPTTLAATQLAAKGADGGGKLANSLLFFLSVAGRHSPEQWLGKEIEQAIARQNETLLQSLKRDIGTLMRSATQEGPNEWRSLLLPLDPKNPDMPMIAMLFGNPHKSHGRHQEQSGDGSDLDDKEEAQRFVLEVQFSVLGAVQLDGSVKGSHFDLSLRSQKALPSSLRQEAKQLFYLALEANGFVGNLNIEEEKAFPIVVEDILAKNLAHSAS